MKRRFVVFSIIAFILTSMVCLTTTPPAHVIAAPAFQKLNFVNGTVTTGFLNIRQGTSTKYPIVCVLKKGETIKIFGKIGDWYAVYDEDSGCVGAAYSNYIKMADTSQVPSKSSVPPVKTNPPTTTAKPNNGSTGSSTTKPLPTSAVTDISGTSSGTSQDERAMLDLVNEARSKAGTTPLAFDAELLKVARLKADDMAQNNYFAHQSPKYGSPFDMMRTYGITFKTAGENIAGNQTIQGAFNAWMNSEGHKKNILNPKFNLSGIGIVSSKSFGKIFVQQFIGR